MGSASMLAARPIAVAFGDDFWRPPSRPRKEVMPSPAFVSSQGSRRSLPGSNSLFPQGRCRDRDRRRQQDPLKQPDDLLTQIKCSSFRQYPILEALVRAASSANDRPTVSRQSSPRTAERTPSAQEEPAINSPAESRGRTAERTPSVEEPAMNSPAGSPALSQRSLNSLPTVQSMEFPEDSGAEAERTPRPAVEAEPLGFLRRALRSLWTWRQ
mmetsp:Transcript_20066/g.47184  ORF Transcript_20066/g.47184 Transcript_20066/m.47184 type:complete len:213 (+) Transcript_20066:47-685(+)